MPSGTLREEIKALFAPGLTWGKRGRKLLNIVDTPIDWVKERLHGMKLPFGYELNISFMMMNRPTTWDIIRKRGDYSNEDPEDLPDFGKRK